MRFQVLPKSQNFQFTDRMRLAFERKLVREQDRYPLFGDHIAEEQHSADEEAVSRAKRIQNAEQARRDFQASAWRNVRRMYFALGEQSRSAVRQQWLAWAGPATPVYLSYLIRVNTGEYAEIADKQKVETERMNASFRSSGLDSQTGLWAQL